MSLDLQQLLVRAASIDELLGQTYQRQLGQKDSTDRAALRLAAWCRSAASGDWGLLSKRLARDHLSLEIVLSKFADVKFGSDSKEPQWFTDAQWTYDALISEVEDINPVFLCTTAQKPFETLFYKLVHVADTKVIENVTEDTVALLTASARTTLCSGLLQRLTDLYAPLLYSKFVALLKKNTPDGKLPSSAATAGTTQFHTFITDLKSTELAEIFNEKPVLLRITATIVRQWIDTTVELLARLQSDLENIRASITHSGPDVKIDAINGDVSDPHNFGHSVQIITLDDQTRLVYKPKDLGLDVAWHDLIVGFNAEAPPVELKPVKAIACQQYGWTEFIEHTSCQSPQELELFYRRSGAWLAVFHLFASSDMHYENIIAHSSHPVPIDLEMILQATTPEAEQETPETAALIEASQSVLNSVLMVGMLPSYTKNPNHKIIDAGGLNAVKHGALLGIWKNTNTDGMRWTQAPNDLTGTPNIPHINGEYAQLGDYLPAFIQGFEQYSRFLLRQRDKSGVDQLLSKFHRLPVRKVIRNTRFYYILLQRLKDHRSMSDGATWSAQAEFLSRLADWDSKEDLLWPLQAAERLALINLNIPHFTSPSDQDLVSSLTGPCTQTNATPGLQRAAKRFRNWCDLEIQRQIQIITVSTSFLSKTVAESQQTYLFNRRIKEAIPNFDTASLAAEATRIATTIAQHATIKEQSAAWVGLDWLGDSEVGQLVTLGVDLYNGTSGIALFLAAHARYTNSSLSRELAVKALAALRLQIVQPSAGRWSRGLGIGGATGLGSIVYALTTISSIFDSSSLLEDALSASRLFSNEFIAADRSLDVIGGSAGGILSLLALYRKSHARDVLEKAIACGEHLLRQPRQGEVGTRSWVGLGIGETRLTGFSHGAAGFDYALSSLGHVTGREDFMLAAHECRAYEDSCYDKNACNWPDLRKADKGSLWSSQWCHGAVGIGLARIASSHCDQTQSAALVHDIEHAVENAMVKWPQGVDTLCCGTLGAIELLAEAGKRLNRPTLGHLSTQRLGQIIANRNEQGDYAWNAGGAAFNLGLFRGLSGVGYTILRRLDPSLPNVLIWE
ncbi:MAG: type 2 lantipeptide synthetase LanM family protein [Candidatus Methylopumilus sp.]|nr:type 2 lantipeptide synthetase LanM family protein [Candidatus Methylopumilus sp.]